METENKSLKDRVETLEKIAGTIGEPIVKKEATWKDAKPPFLYRGISKKKKRDGYVIVIHGRRNKAAEFEKCKVEEGVYVGKDGIPHTLKPSQIIIWKRKTPYVVQPEWSQEPLDWDDHYRETLKNKQGSMGYKLVVNHMHKTLISEKKKGMAMGGMILIGILVIGGIYYAIKSGAFT